MPASWFAIFAGAALKSSAVLLTAWILALVLRGRSAAARHLVWTAAAAAVLALPILSVWMPPLSVPTPTGIAESLVFRISVAAQAPLPQAANMAHAPAGPDWRTWTMLLWSLVTAAGVAQIVAGFAGIRRVRRAASPWSDRLLVREMARKVAVRREVSVLETGRGSMPLTFGVWKPVIFMPADAASWSGERRRIVLLHELAHVRRGDAATQLVARLALILNWWNPLAWLAWREFLKERERATDDLVLQAGERASDYASHLLEVARTMHAAPPLAWAHVAMARRSQLEGRLAAILDARVRGSGGWAPAAAAAAAALIVAAPLASVRVSAAVPAPVLMSMGQSMIQQKNYAQAIDYFERAQKLDASRSAMARMWMGVIREKQHDFAGAEVMYRSALAAASVGSAESVTIRRMYALFLQRQGREGELSARRVPRLPATPTPGVLHVGHGVSAPALTFKIEPQYSEPARTAKLAGTVVLYIEVGADGLAHNIQVMQGLGLGLDEKAVAAVSQWRFRPGMKDGAAVPVAATVEVNFRLL